MNAVAVSEERPKQKERSLDHYVLRGLEANLESSLQNEWNARIVEYDENRFSFHKWALKRIQDMGYPVEDLRYLHEVATPTEIYKITKQLCADTNEPEFRKLVFDFVRQVIVPKGKLKIPVAVQRFLNVRIMQPNKPQGIFPFHTGLLYGHGPASRSIWMPLTDVSADEDYTATMQIIDVNRSRELTRAAIENRYDVKKMSEKFGEASWPLKTKPGQVVFFTQENIHGNFVNVTGKTRVSIDFRIAEAQYGDKLARKIPGGYFEIIPDSDSSFETASPRSDELVNGKPNVIYLANATPGTEGAPVHLQRYMVYEYCARNNLTYDFEYFELEAMTHLPTLNHITRELKSNVILYSVYALPADREFRKKIVDAALQNGLIMHFVNENMVIRNETDRGRVEALLSFAKCST